jgi:hypothetical protein
LTILLLLAYFLNNADIFLALIFSILLPQFFQATALRFLLLFFFTIFLFEA